ncbi:uncharacterized protein [Dysidea avara]|uniref:uncharacterized protein n=1 Tax=Dysidea avara TaxID=196820 RepID=UPI003327FA08
MILNVQHKISNEDEVFVWLMQPNLDVDSGSTIHSALVYLCDKLVPLVSTKWYDLGLMLLDPVQLRLLQETEEQNKQFAFPYCQMMLSKWLHMFNAATWYQLIKAARSIKLKDIADSIEFLLLQGVVGSKDVTTSCKARISSPTMKELDRYVVPLIGTKWYHIGLVLLDAKHALDQLEKQYKHYTQHYCQLLFSTWLCISDNAT